MTRTEASALRDEIRATGTHCVIQKGTGPRDYFARIYSRRGRDVVVPVDFYGPDWWAAWQEAAAVEDAQRARIARPRSPLDAMIDKACGITERDYR